MKQKLNFARWRHFSGPSIFSTTKRAPPGGEIKFVFHRRKSTFPALSHAKKLFAYLYPIGELQKFRGLKKRR